MPPMRPKLLPIVLTFLALFFLPGYLSAQVTANFTASSLSTCGDTVISFTDASTGSPTSWEWDFGDGSGKAYNQNPSHSYASSTTSHTYTVKLTAKRGTSSSTKTISIVVHETPSVDFSATPTTGCPELNVVFTDRSTAGGNGSNTYNWYYAALGTGTGYSSNHLFTASGSYNITLVVINSWGCRASATKNNYINVLTKPTASFSVSPGSGCSSPDTTILTSTSTSTATITSYTWDFGDASSPGTGSSVSHTYTGIPQCWSPKLVIKDANGCSDTVIQNNAFCTYDPKVSSTVASSVCIYTPTSVSATGTPSGGSYSWDWGDGSPNTSGPAANHTYASSGTKAVVVTYIYHGCSVTATKYITVNPKPVGDFTTSPNPPCEAPATITFTPTGNATSYIWKFGDNSPASTQTSPSHTYTRNGFYTDTMIIQSSAGCIDTIIKRDSIRLYDMRLDAYAGDTFGCKPLIVYFKDSVYTTIPNGNAPYPYTIASYQWDFGDGSPQVNQQFPSHTYTDTGIFRAWLKVTSVNGCTTTDTIRIMVGQPPNTDFLGNPQHICNNNFVYFQDQTTGPVDEWLWDFGDGHKSKSPAPAYKYTSPGVYTVKLVSYFHKCPDTMIKNQYITVDSPGSAFRITYSCDTIKKVNIVNETVGATSRYWDFGDGYTDTSKAPSHVYSSFGNYTIMLVSFNSRSGCRDTLKIPIIIAPVDVTLTAADTAICQYTKTRFTSTITGLQAFGYSWYIDGHLVNDSAVNYTYQFNYTGYHTVKVRVFDEHGCWNTLEKTNWIFVSHPTLADTAIPLNGCVPLTVNFTDNSTVPSGATIASRKWDFGNGITTTTSATISNKYNAAGNYTIKLYVTDNLGCNDSLIKPAYVNAYKPDAFFSVPDTVCLHGNVNFSNGTSGDAPLTFTWDFGDKKPLGNTPNPTHVYDSLGTFDVTLFVTDGHGCKDTLAKKAVITTVKPTVAFDFLTDSVAVCAPLFVRMQNTSVNTVAPYTWDYGDGNQSTFTNGKNLYTAPGYYRVVLTAQDSHGCVDSAVHHVNILGYSGAFTYTPLQGCKPLTVTFTSSTTNVASMTWDFSDGYTATQAGGTITHTYDHAGSYTPKVLFRDANGCKALSEGLDEIKVDAVEPDFYADAPCQFNTVTLRDTTHTYFSPVVIWHWTFDDGTTSDKQYPKHLYGPPGNYPVTLYAENQWGCKDSITKDIIIHGLPEISAGGDTIVCLSDSAHLQASGGVSYHWTYSPYLSCLDCPDPYANPPKNGFFIVTGTDQYNCKNTDTVNVTLKYKVTATASGDQEICQKEHVILDARGGKTYLWLPPDGLDNNQSSSPSASPLATTKYTVISYEGRCIPDTDQVRVQVDPLPTVKATGGTTIVAGNSTTLLATGNLIERFKWKPSESLNHDDIPDPIASPLKTTEYTIVVYTDHNCQDSDKVTIKVLCDKSQLYIPNTFTPNGDGQNDIFYPRGTGLDKIKTFRIYSRWGELVYEKTSITINDKAEGWDGTFNGNVLPPDVFVYMIEAQCEDGQTILFKGDITLVR